MNRDDILGMTSMPFASPSYPRGPFRFYDREYLLIHYESDPEVIRRLLPEPLEPDGNHVFYEWMKMPDSSGFGSYQESGCGIAALFEGKPCNFTLQMYLDDEPPTTAGREIWGFPKKYGLPDLRPIHDTLTGTLRYDDVRVALGTLTYKEHNLLKTDEDRVRITGQLGKLGINLKFIPDVDGSPKIAQLVGYNMQDIDLKFAFRGEARLDLVPHVNARVADLPVRKILYGQHLKADMTLPYGRVLHDYLA